MDFWVMVVVGFSAASMSVVGIVVAVESRAIVEWFETRDKRA